jgi:hypothetical protein
MNYVAQDLLRDRQNPSFAMQEENWKDHRKLAEQALQKPGMYLIALRAHLNRGQAIVSEMLDTVTDALPKPPKLQRPEQPQ